MCYSGPIAITNGENVMGKPFSSATAPGRGWRGKKMHPLMVAAGIVW